MTTNNLKPLTIEQAEQAISYAKSGASDAEIAAILRVDPDALRSIAGQMAACRMKMKLAVSKTLLRNAAKGDRVAARGHRKFRPQAALDAYPNEYELLSKNVDEGI